MDTIQPKLNAAYAHCEAVLRADDPDAWLAALFAPADRRPHIHALRAVFGEFGRVRDRVKQPLAGELRLQWWQDALAGEARGDADANPLAAAMLDTVARFSLPRAPILDAVEAYRADLYDDPLPSTESLRLRFDTTLGHAIALECQVLAGAATERTGVADAAAAIGIAGVLRSLRSANPRTALVPDEILAQVGLTRAELEADAGSATAAAEVLRDVARTHLAKLRGAAAAIASDAAPAFLPTALVEPLLRLSERPSRSPRERLALPRWRVQWILWMAARRGRFV